MQDNEQTPALAQRAINNFIISDDVASIRQSLTDLLFEWFRSEQDHGKEERRLKLSHYQSLNDLLVSLEEIESINSTEGGIPWVS